jgi:hypothetical protein
MFLSGSCICSLALNVDIWTEHFDNITNCLLRFRHFFSIYTASYVLVERFTKSPDAYTVTLFRSTEDPVVLISSYHAVMSTLSLSSFSSLSPHPPFSHLSDFLTPPLSAQR